MKTVLMLLGVAAMAPSFAFGCACSAVPADAAVAVVSADKQAPARHPLKGVVVDVMADRSALLVKHEEIPGVMKAMTMLLTVDEAGLKAAKKGEPVTGMLVRKADGWWLEDVNAATVTADATRADS